MVILNRILHGHNVLFEIGIHIVNHGCDGGCLTATGWTSHQEKTAGTLYQLARNFRQANLLKAKKPVWNESKNHGDKCFLTEHADTETRRFAETKAKISSALLLKLSLIFFRRDGLHQRHGVIGIKNLGLQIAQPPIQSNSWLTPYGNVKIGRVLFHHDIKQTVNLKRATRCWIGSTSFSA